jgi:hypothetical protein
MVKHSLLAFVLGLLVVGFTCAAGAADAGPFMVRAATGGIAVFQLSGKQATPVTGSPFHFNPFPNGGGSKTPEALAMSPDGNYLYAVYFSNEGNADLGVASFAMVNGVPQLVSTLDNVGGGGLKENFWLLTATSTAVYIVESPNANPAFLNIVSTNAGMLTLVGQEFWLGIDKAGRGIQKPLAMTVNQTNQYALVTYDPSDNPTQWGTCTNTQCIALFDLENLPAPGGILPQVSESIEYNAVVFDH